MLGKTTVGKGKIVVA